MNSLPETKVCTKCKIEKPNTLEYFYKQGGRNKVNLRSSCIRCLNFNIPYALPKETIYSRTELVGDCWFWTGNKDKLGYGHIYYINKNYLVHRISFELSKGPIPTGLVIDHVCEKPSCINPEHLDAVTQKENVNRARRKRHCISCICVRNTFYVPQSTGKKQPKNYDDKVKWLLSNYEEKYNGCHIWRGHVSQLGYGKLDWGGKRGATAHRAVYSVLRGEIPKQVVIDHTCGVRNCVNIAHLDPVTRRENNRRSWIRKHCYTCSCYVELEKD
jgi:hypothetical protein